MTAGGGIFIEFFLMRNKRSAQWAVAPIEVAEDKVGGKTDGKRKTDGCQKSI